MSSQPLWTVMVLAACLLAAGRPGRAQVPDAVPLPPPALSRPVTLAQALRALPPDAVPEGAVLLCVGADRVPPSPPVPDPSPAPGAEPAVTPESRTDEGVTTMPTDPLGILVLRYGRSLQAFGHVQALAPPAMTVLDADPNLANLPLADLVTQSPLPFLLGTLTPEQWQKLPQTGLGMADLSADQQSLLRAALPAPFKVAPTATASPSLDAEKIKSWTAADWQRFNTQQQAAQKVRDAQTQTVPDDLLARDARFRAYLESEFVFDVPGQSGYGIGVASTPLNGPKPNAFELTDAFGQQQQAGDRLSRYFKAEVPNELKDGDLRWNRHEMNTPVPLGGFRDVDGLVARLAKATGLELYAAVNYGGLPLSAVGSLDRPQPARDVLQALALCVCGAWRQVGPAYVLTDDVVGLAVRKAKMKEIVDTWSDRLHHASEGIGDHLHDLQWAQTLPFVPGDPAALPDDLRRRVAADPGAGDGFGAGVALHDLPPSLQSRLRDGLHEYEQGTDMKASAAKIDASLTPQTQVHVEFRLRFAFDLPGFGSLPLDLNSYRPKRTPAPPPGPGTPETPILVKPMALTESRRAVLCAPTTTKQARDVVDKLAALGLNTLFCDVFTGGHTYVANSGLPPLTDEAGSVLSAAIAEGAKRHVAVYAVLDTLCWRRDALDAHPTPLPDGVMEDRTLQGETLAQFVGRQLEAGRFRSPYERGAVQSQGERGWVRPTDPQVRARLEGLVRAVAAVPGLAGLAFQDTAPPGYLGGGDTGGSLDVELGYTLDQRLAYLRARHADPIDFGGWRDTYLSVSDGGSSRNSLDVSVPSFGDAFDGKPWDDWRAAECQGLLADLWDTAHRTSPGLPLWMREQRIGFTFDPWMDPKTVNKADDLRAEGNALGKRVTQDSILVVLYPGWPDRLEDLSGAIREFRQEFGGGKATGLLLDLTADGPDPDPVRTLGHLAPLFTVAPLPAPRADGVHFPGDK